MNILGIESSCDETGVAIYNTHTGLIAEQLYSQVLLHETYGGVVPELASRDHIRKLLPLIQKTCDQACIKISDLNAIAYTKGPGLLGPLLIGATVAKSLGWALKIPTLGVHHMEGHLLAAFMETQILTYPFAALLVSGGHTLLVDVKGLGAYQILGESLDDAVGEAFDKTAKLLGLGYPGGARLSKLAEVGSPTRYTFPRPMINRPSLDFSFSGLKTFALNTWEQSDKREQTKADIAKAFELAIVETLVHKCEKALNKMGYSRLVMAGGVSANTALRASLEALATRSPLQKPLQIIYPRQSLCTDNGAMIAYAGALRLQEGEQDLELAIAVKPRWTLETLTAPLRASYNVQA